MTILLFIAIFAVIGCVLYLPFFVWFRYRSRRPAGDGPLSANVNATPVGWLVLVVQLGLMLGAFAFASQHRASDPGLLASMFARDNRGDLKVLVLFIVVSMAIGPLARRFGIGLEHPAPTPTPSPVAAVAQARGYRVATIFGVPIFVRGSYLLGGAVVALFGPRDAASFCGYVAAYAALLALHEAGHAVVARRLGLKVHAVELSGTGGLCRVDLPTRTRDIWLVFTAGLTFQAAVLLGTLAVVAVRGAPASPFGAAVVTTFTWVNATLFIINALPGRTLRGLSTDGGVLWRMARHQLGKGAHPFVPTLGPSTLFDPSTALLGVDGMAPDGFRDGIEILNDDTSPMEFVVAILERHAGLAPDVAFVTMLDIHMRGGVLLPFPDRASAREAADAIARNAHAQGHRLVCRAVSRDASSAPATSLAGA